MSVARRFAQRPPRGRLPADLPCDSYFSNLSYGPKLQKALPFKLFVNGKLIASKEVTVVIAGR